MRLINCSNCFRFVSCVDASVADGDKTKTGRRRLGHLTKNIFRAISTRPTRQWKSCRDAPVERWHRAKKYNSMRQRRCAGEKWTNSTFSSFHVLKNRLPFSVFFFLRLDSIAMTNLIFPLELFSILFRFAIFFLFISFIFISCGQWCELVENSTELKSISGYDSGANWKIIKTKFIASSEFHRKSMKKHRIQCTSAHSRSFTLIQWVKFDASKALALCRRQKNKHKRLKHKQRETATRALTVRTLRSAVVERDESHSSNWQRLTSFTFWFRFFRRSHDNSFEMILLAYEQIEQAKPILLSFMFHMALRVVRNDKNKSRKREYFQLPINRFDLKLATRRTEASSLHV